MQKAREDLQRAIHDHNFAKELAEIPDDEWEESGDNIEKPLCARDSGDYFFKVYSKGLVIEELVNGERVSLSAIGVAICDQMDNLIFELKKPLIKSGLNKSAAETKALIEGLNAALSMELDRVRVFIDCFPLFQFVTGRWPAKQRKISVLVDQVSLLEKRFSYFKPRHVARNDMKYVYELARAAINSQMTVPAEIIRGKTINETCVICLEDTDVGHMFSIDGCLHRYCFLCMKKHIEEKLRQGMEPTCPHEGCKSKLKVESCRIFLTLKLFEIWNQRMKEALIPVTEKVYCPYPKCSALMSKSEIERDASSSSFVGRQLGARKCTKCHRRFCIDCKVPWHNNMTCIYYKRLNPNPPTEDVKLKSLASSNLWRQCVKCNHLIELAEGCFHMTCRCGHEFCYNCGAEWKNKKATCSCPLWDEDNILDDDSDSSFEEEDDDDDEIDEYESEFESEEEFI